jgi:hypothetical protein
MPNPIYPVTIDTIGKLIDHGMIAFMWCLWCPRSADIDLEKLAEHVGRDWYFIARRWPLKCAECGSSNVETRIGKSRGKITSACLSLAISTPRTRRNRNRACNLSREKPRKVALRSGRRNHFPYARPQQWFVEWGCAYGQER